MSSLSPQCIFQELTSKLLEAGLPQQQARIFAEECLGFRDFHRDYARLFEGRRMPSEDCFRTLAEAQRVHESTRQGPCDTDLEDIHLYLQVPYASVTGAKKAAARVFRRNESELEELYAREPEWLLVSADAVHGFADFLSGTFRDPELCWGIYREAALLGLEETRRRIQAVLSLLGEETGEAVIRNDLQRSAWLYYRWYTDPVACIRHLLERGLTPGQVRDLLQREPLVLYAYKQGRRLSYNHNQRFIDSVVQAYTG